MVGRTAGTLLVLGLYLLQLTAAANILGVFSYSFPSPFLIVTPYIRALVNNGHNVTIISGDLLPSIEGVHHIRVKKISQLTEDLINYDFKAQFPMNKWKESAMVSEYFFNSSNYILSDAGVQALLHDRSAHFDMVIVQTPLPDALCGIAKHFDAFMVGLSVVGTSWTIDYMAGNKAPSVYEPISSSGYSNGFSALDKLRNWMYITEEWLLQRLIFLPKQMQLYKHHFNQSGDDFHQLRRNFSLMLVNQHFTLGRARSNVPNLIEMAGIHLEQPTMKLEGELLRFVDEAPHGVIVLSMGMEIVGRWMPRSLIRILQKSFEQFPQRIVWKYEQTLPNKSDNIFTTPLLPQRELLAHPNVKLFITHGGILSIIEGVYYGVPMLCLPFYFDQFGNGERMKQAGVALMQDITTITVESSTAAIKDLLENPLYTYNIKQMSKRLRDQPMSPLQTAVWWTEYVLRHDGAPHMRISEKDMSFMQYYSLDFISMLLGRIGLAILIVGCVGLKLFAFLTTPLHLRLSVPLINLA